jgi:hypothetical protein
MHSCIPTVQQALQGNEEISQFIRNFKVIWCLYMLVYKTVIQWKGV